MFHKYIVAKDYHNARLDKWFKAKVLNIPQSLIEKIIRKKKIKVNKKKTKTSFMTFDKTDPDILIVGFVDGSF